MARRKRKPQNPSGWKPSYTTYKDGLPADRTVQPSTPVVADRPTGPIGAPAITPGGVGPRGIPGGQFTVKAIQQETYARDGYVSSADFVPDEYDLLPTDARVKYGSTGIEAQNEIESDRGAQLGLTPATGPTRETTLTPNQRRWPAGPADISRADANSLLPLSMRLTWDEKQQFVISNYPTLAKAAQTAGLTPDEVRDVTNLTLAVDAAMKIGKTPSQRTQMELLRSMPKPQAALVIDVLNGMSQEYQRQSPEIDSRLEVAGLNASVDVARQALERASGEQQNPVLAAVEDWFWNPSVNVSGLAFVYPDTDWGPIQDGELYFGAKGALDTLLAANEMTIRGVTTAMLAPGNGVVDAWNATEAGSFDPTMIQVIKENNDPLTVDIMLDFKKLAIRGEGDPIGVLLAKYAGNPAAERIINEIIFNTDPDSDISKLANEIDTAETSNIANVAGWSFGAMFGRNAADYADIESKASNSAVTGATAVGNMALTLAFDPTLGAARAASGYKIARYGLAKMAPGRIDQVFKKGAVRNHYDYLGKQFEQIRGLEDVGQQAQRLETLASQNRKWYDYTAVRTMFDAGIKNADDAKLFFEDGANVEVLLSGQTMKRGREWTVPHITKATAVWKATTLKLRGLNPANMGGSAKFIDAVFGEGTSAMLPEDAAKRITDMIEQNPQAAGRVLSDWAITDEGGVQRTILGKVVGVNTEKHTMRNRYGWRRKGLTTGDFDWFADRLGRLMARMPDSSRGVAVDTAEDAGTVKQVAQSLGMSRYFANYLKFVWPSLDEPARIRLINGLNATAVTASGIDLVSPQLAADMKAAFAIASRPTTQYAADQVDVLAIRQQAERAVEALDRQRKAENLAAFTAGERAAAVDDEMARIITESTDLDATLAEMREIITSLRTNRKDWDTALKEQLKDYKAQIPRVSQPGRKPLPKGAKVEITYKDGDELAHATVSYPGPHSYKNSDVAASFSWNPRTGRIQNVVTAPSERRKGLATSLFDRATKWADENGYAIPQHSDDLSDDARAWIDSINGPRVVQLTREQRESIKTQAAARLDKETDVLETAPNGTARGVNDGDWPELAGPAYDYFEKYGVIPLSVAKAMLASRNAMGGGRGEDFWLWLTHGVIDGADEAMYASAQVQGKVGELEAIAGTLRQLVPDLPAKKVRRAPGPSADELREIMDPETAFDRVQELVKGKSFTREQAKTIRDRYGIKVIVLRGENANQQLFVPVAWKKPLSTHGTEKRLKGHIETLTTEFSDDALANYDNLQAGLRSLENELKAGFDEIDQEIAVYEARAEAIKKAKEATVGLTGPARGQAFNEAFEREFKAALDNGGITNPSSLNATDNYALHDWQLTRRVSIFDAQKMSQIMARQSYLNMFLGTGPTITNVTDLWTLATLAGPRFVMRSGLEDFGLYALTGGKFFGHGGWLDGRRASAAIREATARGTTEQIIRGSNPGMKLGLAATARREIGTRLARAIPAARGLVLPYLSADEVAQATAMAAARGPERSREPLAHLFASAFLRGRFFSVNRVRYARGEDMLASEAGREAADILTDGVRRGYLPQAMARSSEVTEHLADGSASALHQGARGVEQVEGVTFTHMKAGIDVRNIKTGFGTTFETGRRHHEHIENLYAEINHFLYDGGYKAYLAIARSQEYFALRMKVLTAKGEDKLIEAQIDFEEFLSKFADEIAEDPNLPRYVLNKELGTEEYVKRILDDALRIMTTRTGKYNYKMLERLRLPNHRRIRVSEDLAQRLELPYRPNKTGYVMVTIRQDDWDRAVKIADVGDRAALEAAGRPVRTYRENGVEWDRTFGTYYHDDEGKFHYVMQVNDLHDPDLPMPQSIGTADEIQVLVSDKLPFTSGAWSRMGRALARMTREPIYLSNYVDAYKAIKPWEKDMAEKLVAGGKKADEAADQAADWAHKWAADKAYEMTMAGVDNPAIRSQLAWQVRNVARFYRALEDFNRRMMRVATNKPETFWKLALTWNVLDDSGFVWEDEYGDKYLMFPGTQAMFQATNYLLSAIGMQPKVPGLPMAWGAKVTMFSPSTDPNAMAPTLGAPMSAAGLKGLLRVMPSLGWINKETSQALEGALFGEYSPQQTLTAAMASDLFGPNMKRVFDAFTATYGGESSRQSMTDTAVAVAGKQAIHAMAAAGIYDPTKSYTEEEILELKAIADTTAVNAVYLKLVMTPNLPATPQMMSTTVSDEARAIGIDSGNALWIKYLNKYPTYEEAFIAFTKDNPGKAIFTVSKYENTDFFESNLETQDFIEANRAEFDSRPTGLSHFAPVEGTYAGLTGFYFARANGLKVPGTVEEFFNRTIRSAGEAEMRYLDVEADALVEAGEDPDKVQKALTAARNEVRAKYPLAEYKKTFAADRQPNAQRDADEIAETARYMIESGQDKDGRAKTYLQVHSEYKIALRMQAETESGSRERTKVNKAWSSYVETEALGLMPADDDRWARYLKILSAGLNVQVEALNGR